MSYQPEYEIQQTLTPEEVRQHALAELDEGIGKETGADALVSGFVGRAPILAQVVATGGDAKMNTMSIAQDRVHAKPAIAGLPLARVLVVADARNHFPGIAAVLGFKESAGHGSAPHDAGFIGAAWRKSPNQL